MASLPFCWVSFLWIRSGVCCSVVGLACLYVCVCVCVCVCTYIYEGSPSLCWLRDGGVTDQQTHIYIHIYTHAPAPPRSKESPKRDQGMLLLPPLLLGWCACIDRMDRRRRRRRRRTGKEGGGSATLRLWVSVLIVCVMVLCLEIKGKGTRRKTDLGSSGKALRYCVGLCGGCVVCVFSWECKCVWRSSSCVMSCRDYYAL